MTIFIQIVRVLGWLLLAFVGIKVAFISYLYYDADMPVGRQVGLAFQSFLTNSEAKDWIPFYALVLGLAFVFKARLLSRFLKEAGEER